MRVARGLVRGLVRHLFFKGGLAKKRNQKSEKGNQKKKKNQHKKKRKSQRNVG